MNFATAWPWLESSSSLSHPIPSSSSSPTSASPSVPPTSASSPDLFSSSTSSSSSSLLSTLLHLGYLKPTPVQSASFALVVQRQLDLVLAAETGSGKTLAYLAPILFFLRQKQAEQQARSATFESISCPTVSCIILVPTRDLAAQIQRTLLQLAPSARVAVLTSSLESLAPDSVLDFLVINPRGLEAACSHLSANVRLAFWSRVQFLVCDEADALLAGNFEYYVQTLLRQLTKSERRNSRTSQTRVATASRTTQQPLRPRLIFVAATLHDTGTKSVVAFLREILPAMHHVHTPLFHHVQPTMRQHWLKVDDEEQRRMRLLELMKHASPVDSNGRMAASSSSFIAPPPVKMLVFFNLLASVNSTFDWLTRELQLRERSGELWLNGHLQQQSVSVAKFHRGVPEQGRQQLVATMNEVSSRSSSFPPLMILLCTDLAARGIDFRGITHVVQYDMAPSAVVHLHRIGRTARYQLFSSQASSGQLIHFYGDSDSLLVSQLRRSSTDQETVTHSSENLSVQDSSASDAVVSVLLNESKQLNADNQQSLQASAQITAFSRRRSLRRKHKKQQKMLEHAAHA